MTAKHTPGPWTFRPSPDNEEQYWIDGPIGLNPMVHDEKIGPPIANTTLRPWITESEANARLMAAAPDLLAALKDLLPMWESGIKEPWVEAARAAIAKATEE